MRGNAVSAAPQADLPKVPGVMYPKPIQEENPLPVKLLFRPSVWRKPSAKSGLKTRVETAEMVTVRAAPVVVFGPRGSVNALPAAKTFVLGTTAGDTASTARCDSAIRICCKMNCKSLTVMVKSAPRATADACCD